jgi:hypothetical protein
MRSIVLRLKNAVTNRTVSQRKTERAGGFSMIRFVRRFNTKNNQKQNPSRQKNVNSERGKGGSPLR